MSELGRYTLVDRIGQGGMAEIWKAKATGPSGFQKTVAIKRVLPHLVEQERFIEMFISEAKLAATLHHPNIVQVFDFGQAGPGNYYIAMEYVSGANMATLQKKLRGRGVQRLPAELALYVIAEAAKGLEHAHSQTDEMGNAFSIIHRDMSPHNLLVSYEGEVKITDFGIAKVAGALGSTATGMVKGKLSYMSPEQACQQAVDRRSDIFSLGLVLWEMLLGEPLFTGETVPEIAMQILQYEAPPEDQLNRLTKPVALILRAALQRDPEARYQRAADMEDAISRALGIELVRKAKTNLGMLVKKLVPQQTTGEVPAVRPTGENDPTLASAPAAPRPATLASNPAVKPKAPLWPLAVGGGSLLIAATAVLYFGGFLTPAPTPTPTPVAVATPVATVNVVNLTDLTPKPTPKPTRKATPKPTRKIVRPTAQATPAPVIRTGTVSVTARPWGVVYIDGKRVKAETPLLKHELGTGVHVVVLKNPAYEQPLRARVSVKADRHITLHADFEAGRIE